jgi:secondary thiamine-phosphate synthase enzyme
MKTFVVERRAGTTRLMDLVDITDEVVTALEASPVRDGHVTVFTDTPGCALVVNERESGLLRDLRSTVERLRAAGEDDARTLLGSSSVVLPATGGRLRLGTWQRLMLAELEGPSDRRVVVQIVGE